MIHTPSVDLALEGSTRFRPDPQMLLLKMIAENAAPGLQQQQPPSLKVPLMCPFFHSRIEIPARFAECQHREVFDLKVFLQLEALWPRLKCPVCG